MRDVTMEIHASDEVEGAVPTDSPWPAPASTDEPEASPRPGWQPPMVVESAGRRWGLWAGIIGGIAALLVAGVLMGTTLPGGTTLAGSAVRTVTDATPALESAAGRLAVQSFLFVSDAGEETALTGADLGLAIDVPASIKPVTQGLPSIGAWLTRLPQGPRHAPLVLDDADPTALQDVGVEISTQPVNAQLDVTRSGIDTTDGEDGLAVSGEDVDQALRRSIASISTTAPDAWPDAVTVQVSGLATTPPVGQADIDGIAAAVDVLENADVTVTAEVILPDAGDEEVGDDEVVRTAQTLMLTSAELRTLVDVEAVPDAPEGQRLRLVPDPGSTPARLVALMDLARIEPTLQAHIENRSDTPSANEDATDVSGVTGDVVLDSVEEGFVPDPEATLDLVIDAALSGGGTVEVIGQEESEIDPAQLGIIEPVSSFTSYYTAGQSRVQNIRRIAEIMDGAVIPAGTSFEVNHFVGRRTIANGFTTGGAILDGELVSDIGGGVSQFATTFFNAAWFAGIDLVDFKAHSFYFSRYPPGREATINYPNVNLEVRNDTPYAILVDTETDATSVTVTFWSTPYWDVQTIMGPCGCGGSFRITNQRILTAPGGNPVTEEYSTTYTVPRDN